MARLLKIVLGSLGLVLATWFGAVLNLPRVKARKAARRAERTPAHLPGRPE